MDTDRIEAILGEDRAVWDLLRDELDARPDQPVYDDGLNWTSADVYSHLARWMDRSTDVFEARLEGQVLPDLSGSDDEINAGWHAEDHGRGLDDSRRGAQQAFDRRLHLLESVPPPDWDDELERIARADGSEHYAHHRQFA